MTNSSNNSTTEYPPPRARAHPRRLQTVKFDDLCYNFYEHEYLDQSEPILTISKNEAGLITGLTMANTLLNGAPIPFTVPTVDAQQVRRRYS